jgi:phosphoribosyl 1,2-cyclic phosphodiesterase
MLCCSLNSGSNGNCIYVEAEGVRLLFDAGISGRQAAGRLATHGRDIRAVDAVIVSHDHADHARCAGIYARLFNLPIYMTPLTHQAAQQSCNVGQIADLRHFRAGQALHIGQVSIEAVATPHDAAEPVAFVVSAKRRRLGILTDLGCVFDALPGIIAELDALYLESNYDPDMLESGPYPPYLKRRIAGRHGHLSNFEAAELVLRHAHDRLQWVSLAHLSEVNNTPDLARRTHHDIVGPRRAVYVSDRYAASSILQVE